MFELNLNPILIKGVISTDDILPDKYKHSFTEPSELAKYIFEDFSAKLKTIITSNTALVANDLFGIGSSREQAVSALLATGVKAILASRFGRIFFRNCWNLGLLAIEVNTDCIVESENLKINLNTFFITQGNLKINFPVIPKPLLTAANKGGLLKHVLNKRKVKKK